jgi:hypothetical protein
MFSQTCQRFQSEHPTRKYDPCSFRILRAWQRDWGSSVVTVSDYRLDDWGSIPVGAKDFSSSPLCPDRLWSPPSLLSNGYRGPFPGGKARPEPDADHSPHLMPRSRMSRSCTSALSCRLPGCSGAAYLAMCRRFFLCASDSRTWFAVAPVCYMCGERGSTRFY